MLAKERAELPDSEQAFPFPYSALKMHVDLHAPLLSLLLLGQWVTFAQHPPANVENRRGGRGARPKALEDPTSTCSEGCRPPHFPLVQQT